MDELENCDQHITPNCVRALYDFLYVPIATEKNSIGIGEPRCASHFDYVFLTCALVEYVASYSPKDLDLFFSNFSKSQVGQRPIFESIDGGMGRRDDIRAIEDS